MHLIRRNHTVDRLQFDKFSSFSGDVLKINQAELTDYVLRDLSGFELDFKIASPGLSQRIIHITDVVMPSYKETGPAFPGWTGPKKTNGHGVTHHIQNLAIAQSFLYPGIQDGLMDMSGQGSVYAPLSSLHLLVMIVNLTDLTKPKSELAPELNMMNLRAAEYVGKLLINEEGVDTNYELVKDQKHPKVGYAYFIQAQGPLRNVHLYADDCVNMTPKLVHPNEILDGALVSGNYIIACQKNPTWFHQNNPVILEAYNRHNKEICFSGVIISTEQSLLEGKQQNADIIAKIAMEQQWKGIILTQEGGGHADVDLMLTAEACEDAGIKVVMLINEIAGPKGALPPLVSWSDKADAIVTTGNNDEIIILPSVEEVIGGDKIAGDRFAEEQLITSLGIIYASTNQLGATKMTTTEY